ncbi:unnamed protein product [Effrenium voratum]|nr:unnamed protein product [Effrenium voratum]
MVGNGTASFAALALVLGVRATILSDAIASGKPPSLKRCLAAAASDINLQAVPSICQEDIQHFYCQRVRDLVSKRYLEEVQHACRAWEKEVPDLSFSSFGRAAVAYVILAHQFPENVLRLISRLLVPLESIFAVHVDEKSPQMYNELLHWVDANNLDHAVQIFSQFNIVRGGPNMLKAEIEGIRLLLNHVIHWDFCVLLSEQDAPPDSAKLGVVWQGRNGASSQPRACMRPCLSRRAEDYPMRANSAFAEYLWMHRGTSFVSVDEDGILVFVCAVTPWVSHATCAVQGECERDVSYQCGDRVVSLSGGVQFPKIPGLRYASGSQWFAISRELASLVGFNSTNPTCMVGTIFYDLTAVKQPDESFFQVTVLNSEFCTRYSDYTLHWTDKDSMRQVRSLTSEYNILSPGVLSFPKDAAKVQEVREQSLWAFFARKFDDSKESSQLKDYLDSQSGRNARKTWTSVRIPAAGRLMHVLASSLLQPTSLERLRRNVDALFHVQMLRANLGFERYIYFREKLSMPTIASSLLSLRVGCSWNKTELVFDGDVSAVSASSSGPHGCPSLWAVAHWRMSKKPVSEELLLVWTDPGGTPMQQAPISISEHSVLLWHRYTATQSLTHGRWSLEVRSSNQVIARRHFFAYGNPLQIPWQDVQEYFDIVPG